MHFVLYFFGGLRGLAGERFHFGGHHRKSLSRLPCACRFNGGVERQQVGLSGNCEIVLITVPILFCALAYSPTLALVRLASATASIALCADWCTSRSISAAVAESSSVAAATVCTIVEVCSDAAATVAA